MKKKSTFIAVLLDRSGSMQTIKPDTIGGFNTFLREQQQAEGSATITLAQFDDQYEVVYENKDIHNAPKLTDETFVPRGWTALLDGMGKLINSTGEYLRNLPENKRPENVIFVILTDGGENASKEFTRPQIANMVKHQREKYSWQFVFLGANMDAIEVAKAYNIPRASTITWVSNPVGTASAYASLSANTVAFRTSGNASHLQFSAEDRKKQADAGAQVSITK